MEGLLQATLWCIGEFGELLISGINLTENVHDEDDDEESTSGPISEQQVLETFSSILKGPYATITIKEYAVTALVKLTARFRDSDVIR